jgi:hypothetical protein
LDVDVIVNAANKDLVHSGGLANVEGYISSCKPGLSIACFILYIFCTSESTSSAASLTPCWFPLTRIPSLFTAQKSIGRGIHPQSTGSASEGTVYTTNWGQEVTVVQGDIIELDVDVIVNAANKD